MLIILTEDMVLRVYTSKCIKLYTLSICRLFHVPYTSIMREKEFRYICATSIFGA